MINSLSNLFRMPKSLIDKAEEVVEKDGDTVVIKKVVYANNEQIVLEQKVETTDYLNSEIAKLDAEIANYRNEEWIASQVAVIEEKKKPFLDKLSLINS